MGMLKTTLVLCGHSLACRYTSNTVCVFVTRDIMAHSTSLTSNPNPRNWTPSSMPVLVGLIQRQSWKRCRILGSGSGEKIKMGKNVWGNWGKLREKKMMWGKNEEKNKKKWGKDKTMRKKCGNTGEKEKMSVQMWKIGRIKWGKLGTFLFLKLRSGEMF